LNVFDNGGPNAFIGCPAVHDPQASGIILGKKELIECCALNAFPNQNSIGRTMKVGKEEIAGLVVALERVLKHDFATDLERWEQQVQTVVDALRDIPGVGVERVFDRPEDSELHPVPIPRAWIELHCADVQKRLLHELETGDPAISVRQVGKTVVAIALQTSCGKVRIRWSRSAADSAAARCTKSGGIAPVIPERWRMCCTRVHR